MKRKHGSFKVSDLRVVSSPEPHATPLRMSERVRLNSGGPVGLIVDLKPDDHVVVAWPPQDDGVAVEDTLPSACVRRVEVVR